MTKYRIVKKDGFYYPQHENLSTRVWWSTEIPDSKYLTEQEALDDIKEHSRIFGEKPKDQEVVWIGEM